VRKAGVVGFRVGPRFVLSFTGAKVDRHPSACHLTLLGVRESPIDQPLEIGLFDLRQQPGLHRPSVADHVSWEESRRGESTICVVIIMECQADLLEIICTTNSSGRLPGSLHGWQQQSDQDSNNRNHNQQLDQSKPRSRQRITRLHACGPRHIPGNEIQYQLYGDYAQR
jgi:hypothetical protein